MLMHSKTGNVMHVSRLDMKGRACRGTRSTGRVATTVQQEGEPLSFCSLA